MKPVVVDWDDTLVDVAGQEWLDGAEQALRQMLTGGHKVIVHTCRANWPDGRAKILAKLRSAHLDHPNVTVAGKPDACVYIDNLAHRFNGWPEALAAIPAEPAKPKAAVPGPILRAVPAPPPRPRFRTFS